MKNTILLFLLLLSLPYKSNSQEIVPIETESHIFWHPDRKLTKEDFQGDGSATPSSKQRCDSLGICTAGFFGQWSVLDIPNKELYEKGIREEKIYFVPAFEKSTSFILCDDTLGIKYQQLIFDLNEGCLRVIRKRLQDHRDALNGATGVKAILLETVKAEVEEYRLWFMGGFYNEIFYKNNKDDFARWRRAVDDMLKEYEKYSTTAEERKRFIEMKPIVDNYEQTEAIIGDMRK